MAAWKGGDHRQRAGQLYYAILRLFHRHRAPDWICRRNVGQEKLHQHCLQFQEIDWQKVL
ncbi:hypothetical protein Tsubulata_001651 [Turnera subulata]|uniref:Uncharacterized protein n=1 Tax=Turnera subulata TaxID=218843 RepID=A0A9Q0JEM4_9ROSI|nr:hypothetical protein Tsubulata_001651 [Turnera subulata]